MPVQLKTQNDYLLTEVSVELPPDRQKQAETLSELDYLMRVSKGSGKIIAVYSDGGLYGINIEQRTKIRGAVADRVREAVGVANKVVGAESNGHHQ
jgi:hypothetical protein